MVQYELINFFQCMYRRNEIVKISLDRKVSLSNIFGTDISPYRA